MESRKLTLSDALITSRPFWWVTTAMPFIVGYFTTRDIVFTLPVVLGLVYFCLPYNLFLYGVNDIYDYESDLRNPRKNSIEGALLDKSKHRRLLIWIAIVNVPFLAYFVAIGTMRSSLWLGLIVLACITYSAKHLRIKEVPFLDSLVSAFRYTAPFLFGIFLGNGHNLYLPVFAAFYLWAMSNHAFGAIQDIRPDKEAGISSIATKLGATNTVMFCFLGYMVAAALPSLIYEKEGIIPTLFMVPYIGLVARTLTARDKENNPIFHRTWLVFTYLNYPLGALLAVYLLSLIKH